MPAELNPSFRIDPADLPTEAVIFGSTQAMREIRTQIDSIISSDLPVLIEGENGTGKEIVARYLHTRSSRQEAPFVKLNCGSIPPVLIERELFGADSGSGAAPNDRPGLVEVAEGGTLFLDQIGDLSWDLQGKLLRLLQDGSDARSGTADERRGRMRIICATNINLQPQVEKGVVREDLFYRIKVVTLRLAPLRGRKCDIPQLCEYLLLKLSRQFRRNMPQLSPVTVDLLKQWDWPGNFRELENWIARAVILGDDQALAAELKRQVSSNPRPIGKQAESPRAEGLSYQPVSTTAEAAILQVLQANHWDKQRTARELQNSYRALLEELREVGGTRRRKGGRGLPRLQ